jgi:putative component of toxin-antitoxin plasmid stabilization module
MRLDIGPGYRLYFTRRGSILIVMPAGGDSRRKRATSNELSES